MTLSRRLFLTGLIAAPVIVRAGILMPVRPDIPWIVGDGVHDDAPGIRAFFAGDKYHVTEPISWSMYRAGADAGIANGRFHLGSTLHLGRGHTVQCCHLSFDSSVETAITYVRQPPNKPLAS